MAVTLSDVSFVQKGNGKDLVFLHGYLSSKEAFAAQIAYFSKFYRVTAIDFLGFGDSKPLTEPFSVADYAAWTREVFSLLDIRNPHIIAHSFGCRVAVKMLAEDNATADKLVMTGPAGIIRKRGFSYHFKVKSYRVVRRFFPRFAERKFGSAEYRSLSPVMRESYKKIVNEDLRGDAARIQNLTLIVEGESDTTTPFDEAKIYLQSLKNGSLKRMRGGHFAFAEEALLFNLITEEFLYD